VVSPLGGLAIVEMHSKIQTIESLTSSLESVRAEGKSVVLCHGVFDLLHPGHIRYFSAAQGMGDVLVVTLTADEFVDKGPGRPAFTETLRAEAVAALEVVDFVAVVEDASALPAIEVVQPNVYVKGGEYADPSTDATGRIVDERLLVEAYGGRIEFTDEATFSSSTLINAFFPQHSAPLRESIQRLNEDYGIDEVMHWLDGLSALQILVVGETILDVYTECEALGKASKEPVLCMNRNSSETHAGGALAVAGHCSGLGAEVSLISGLHSSDLSHSVVKQIQAQGIHTTFIETDPRRTIRKERIIDSNTQARVLELYSMDDEPLEDQAQEDLLSTIRQQAAAYDAVVVADFGHGFMHDRVIELLAEESCWLAVNAQANAGNHGFNSIQRYPRADFVTLNGNEARLEARRRHIDFDSYIPRLCEILEAQAVLVTQGAAGLDIYRSVGDVTRSPALAPFVKDRVGAGDAVLAVTSMLTNLGAPTAIIGFIGNLVGAWAVSFLGNQRIMDIGTLKRQVVATLK